MAIETTNKDISTRGVTNTTLAQFAGRARQVVINIDDGFRPIVMDGSTLGGKFKVASLADIQTALDDYEPSGNFLTVEDAAATYATKSEVTSSLAGKANTSHTHAQSDVTGLSAALDAKANTAHSHNQSDVVGLETSLSSINTTLGNKSDVGHTHEIANVNGLQTALDSKQAAGNYAQFTHSHTKSQITDFTHTHTTSEITNLDSTLAAKADSSALANLVPKTSSRGELAGYETPLVQATALTINGDSRDSNLVTGAVAITVSNGVTSQSWTKTVALSNASATISLGSNWKWVGGTAPSVSANCVVVLHWCNSFGIANLAATS